MIPFGFPKINNYATAEMWRNAARENYKLELAWGRRWNGVEWSDWQDMNYPTSMSRAWPDSVTALADKRDEAIERSRRLGSGS